MFGNKTIKFDYDKITISYNKLLNIQEKSKESLEKLKKACDEADNSMKGKYRKAFNAKQEEIFKDFEKTAVDGIEKLANIMNKASKEMESVELEVIKNMEASTSR
ncbi:MAG: WXG100 family type VII secretion target [Clostridium sp.]|nr:WXG100 family type VII secretion target [Clostridium sp.]